MKRFPDTALLCILLSAALMVAGCSCKPKEDPVRQQIEAISSMKEIGLVEYRVRKIIKADDQGEWYKIGDRMILLSCTAYLKAGIDLSEFSPDDVEADRKKGMVTVTLPHARLLSIDIPPSEIRQEWDQVTLLRWPFSAKERNELLRQGERQIRGSVPSLGILQKAEENAVKFFKGAFSELGFNDVNVVFK